MLSIHVDIVTACWPAARISDSRKWAKNTVQLG